MALVEKVVTDLTFHEGRLVPPGSVIYVDTDRVQLETGNNPNLAEPGTAPVLVPVAVMPIGPTGPYPVLPQQIPPGTLQTSSGYAAPGGASLVAAGSQAAIMAEAEGEEEQPIRRDTFVSTDATQATIPAAAPVAPLDAGLNDEERKELERYRAEALERRQATIDAATGEPPAPEGSDGFDADAIIQGSIPDVLPRLDALSNDELERVKAAELDREQSRSGVTNVIDEMLAKRREQA